LGAPAPAIIHDHPGGEEIFVVEGSLIDEHGRYPEGTWLRAPSGSVHSPYTDEGCVLWVKSGHLPG
ncbi:MAG: cupin domain-containing protein, partial [Rhodospirillaceae bacterium]